MSKSKHRQVFKPFKRESAHSYVLEKIKESIISGVYSPGEQLPNENDLCDIFGVSRAVIREVLRELEGMGLIETVLGSKGGRFVKKINASIIADGLNLILRSKKATYEQVLEARKVIESAAARMAAVNRTEEQLAMMLKVVDLRTKSKEKFIKNNYKLHEIVALSSQNMILFYLLQALRKLIYSSYDLIPFEDIPIELANELHWAIYQAIKDRNPDQAGKAIINDLDAFSKIWLESKKKYKEI